jgi:ketosteroid isomerase-like protein
MKQILVSTLLIFSITAFAQKEDEQNIKSILTQQTIDWNKGNVDAFMLGYWNNDSVVFMGKNGPVYGYQNTLKNYKKSYPNAAAMGKLSFDIITVKKLSVNYYFVIGKYFLTRTIGNANGVFTLLFKKINREWKIIADHSS